MVLPYLKGLVIINGFSILLCGSIVYSICGDYICISIWFLTSGIRALSLAGVVGNYFLFLQIFFFRRRKNRAATFQTFSVYFCEKFAEKGCISEFPLRKTPKLKKKIVRNRVREVKILKF
jgi:hypothetical protein